MKIDVALLRETSDYSHTITINNHTFTFELTIALTGEVVDFKNNFLELPEAANG
jgi:hypothetical protein